MIPMPMQIALGIYLAIIWNKFDDYLLIGGEDGQS